MNDKIDSDSTWCGTFQLVWNDMINEVVRQDILFKDNNDMVTNLNKMDFNTSMISEEYYYKKYGFKTLSLKKEIEQGIKNKFNQTSDILDSFSWSQDELSNNDDRYFFYTMLYREFEYNNKFSVLKNDKFGNYDDVVLPKRGTISSAGYDFYSVISVTLKPGERKVIPTGIKVLMNDNEFLGIFIRSSLGFKYNVRMCNQVGIIDADYYGNSSNGGHIFVCLENEGDEVIEIKKGNRFVQGIFIPYLITDDDNTTDLREGGIGSTNDKGDDL
jgi:dUTP pyrophosphatase